MNIRNTPYFAKMNNLIYLVFLTMTIGVLGCKRPNTAPGSLPALTKDGTLQAIVTTPAGTVAKYKPDRKQRLILDSLSADFFGKPILPAPGNFCYIHGLKEGTKVNALLLANHQPVGTIVQGTPVGLLAYRVDTVVYHTIVAIPLAANERVTDVNNYADFAVHFSPAKLMIENWLLSSFPLGKAKIINWRNERIAINMLESSAITGSGIPNN